MSLVGKILGGFLTVFLDPNSLIYSTLEPDPQKVERKIW